MLLRTYKTSENENGADSLVRCLEPITVIRAVVLVKKLFGKVEF